MKNGNYMRPYNTNKEEKIWKNIKFTAENSYLKKFIPVISFYGRNNRHTKPLPPPPTSSPPIPLCDIPVVEAPSNLFIELITVNEEGKEFIKSSITKMAELMQPKLPSCSNNSVKPNCVPEVLSTVKDDECLDTDALDDDEDRWKNIKFTADNNCVKKIIPYLCFNVNDVDDSKPLPPPPIPLRDIPPIKAPSNLFFELTAEDNESIEQSFKNVVVLSSPKPQPSSNDSIKSKCIQATKTDDDLDIDYINGDDDDERWKNIKFTSDNTCIKKIIPYLCFNVNDDKKRVDDRDTTPPPPMPSAATQPPSNSCFEERKCVESNITKHAELPLPSKPNPSSNIPVKVQSNSPKTMNENICAFKKDDTVIFKKFIPSLCFSSLNKEFPQRRLPRRSSDLLKLEINSFLKPQIEIIHGTSK